MGKEHDLVDVVRQAISGAGWAVVDQEIVRRPGFVWPGSFFG